MSSHAVANTTGRKPRGNGGFKPNNAGQHSHLAYAQTGDIVFEPFFTNNDVDLEFFKERKWVVCCTTVTAIAMEVGAARV